MFHTHCVKIEMVPEGDWYCVKCDALGGADMVVPYDGKVGAKVCSSKYRGVSWLKTCGKWRA